MYFIFGNFGNNTIALIQWAHAQKLKNVTVVQVETGWGASTWKDRSTQGQVLATRYDFATKILIPTNRFEDLVRDRRSFPNAKYQWCSTFLKALPFLSWLDEVDDRCESIIILGARREDSRARINLPEFIEESEHYGGRKVWHPLYNVSTLERDRLIEQAGFAVLNHRSLECDPCIHSQLTDFQSLENNKISRIMLLEQEVGETMFHSNFPNQNIEQLVIKSRETKHEHANLELFDMGCGSHYSCGE